MTPQLISSKNLKMKPGVGLSWNWKRAMLMQMIVKIHHSVFLDHLATAPLCAEQQWPAFPSCHKLQSSLIDQSFFKLTGELLVQDLQILASTHSLKYVWCWVIKRILKKNWSVLLESWLHLQGFNPKSFINLWLMSCLVEWDKRKSPSGIVA